MSAGAYLMVKFSDRSKLVPAVQQISSAAQITKWDAVDGHYNLVLKTSDPAYLEKVKSFEGLDKVISVKLVADNEKTEMNDELSYCYAYIETAPDKKEEIQNKIEALDAVFFCSPVEGNYDLVAMFSGENFDKIERVIDNTVRNYDGILRLKHDHVIFLDKL